MSLHSEILEQPQRLATVLERQRTEVERIAREIRSRGIQYIFLAARGTSDNAGRYANYLFGGHNRIAVALATPSLFTFYKKPPRLEGALVVGISQSGQSPDIVSVLDEGRRQGCLTLAITNEPDSPLAKAADFVLDIMAGPELATAATKTYTNELMVLAMLSTALEPESDRWAQLAQVPAWADEALRLDVVVEQAAQRYRYMQQCVVIGRGYNYSTAFEWALKLKELTYTMAEPYSSADFLHGPIAMVGGGFPVLAIAPHGAVSDTVLDLLTNLKQDLKAELVVISDRDEALALAQSAFRMPSGIPEWLSPMVSIVPAQLFAYHLTLIKGFEPDHPRVIHKVTETR